MNDERAVTPVSGRSRWLLSGEKSDRGRLPDLHRYWQARYMEFAGAAARDEREGRYTAAAEGWGEALKTASGANVDWCQSRLTWCLQCARSPSPARTMTQRVARG